MKPELNKNYLITTTDWFLAPDGKQYKAAWGNIKGIFNDQETLGIKTNSRSTNWYLSIGNMIIAGCQIHYLIQTDIVNFKPVKMQEFYEGKLAESEGLDSRIYNANL